MKNKQFNPEKRVPLWQKVVGYLNIFLMIAQLGLPTIAHAFIAFDEGIAEQTLNYDPAFTKVSNSDIQFKKSEYVVEQSHNKAVTTIESFHKKLLAHKKSGLHAPTYIPIMNDGITIIFPHYELDKRVGDRFVQSRMIRSQVYAALNRNLISDNYNTEAQQIEQLYLNAFDFAGITSTKFGDKVTASQVKTFNKNFIWPELRTINGEQVLVPALQLTQATIDKLEVNGHVAEFGGTRAEFNSINIKNGTLTTQRNTFVKTANDLRVNPGAEIRADGDLNLFVGGTLQNLSGRLSAKQNVDIIANQYHQKTVVHRYATAYEQGTRFGEIASVDANGNIRIRTYGDIVVEGGTIFGNTIGLRADGNIILKSQQTSYVNNQPQGRYDQSMSEVEHLTTKLNAQDSIFLMASGAIELRAAELHADQGVIEILAGQGVYISNEFNEFQRQGNAKWGKTTEQEQEFQTIAIRSALEAGKGVMIASQFGDITLKAADIKSATGTQISARNGRVNLLLAKEQDHYFYNKVKKGFWKIKTETKQDTTDTAVYNQIIGGVKVHATHGIALELGQYEGESVTDVINQFSGDSSLSWMSDIYNDPKYNCPAPNLSPHNEFYARAVYEAIQQDADFNNCSSMLEVVYTKLENIHTHEKTSNLSPAAMAIIAIAVAVAMGPAGAGWIGSEGAIVGAFESAAMGSAMSAGAVTLTTSVATSLANGEGIDGAIKKITSSDGLRSLAISMATAGVLNSEAMKSFNFFNNADIGSSFYNSELAIDIAHQATQAVVESTVRASITAVINGESFGDSFKQSLLQYGVEQLGEYMSGQIKELAGANNWPDAIKYIAHAGAGCIYGAALAEVSGSNANPTTCASGAGGAVIGEIIGDAQREKILEREKQLNTLLEGEVNLMLANSDLMGIDAEVAKLKYLQERDPIILRELNRLKAAGVDLAKLGAGLAAFAAGGDVNISASAGQNAAEHNALILIFIPVVLKLIDTALLINDFIEVSKVYDSEGVEKGDQALQSLIVEMGVGLAVSQIIPGSKLFEKFIDGLRASGQNKAADSLYAMAESRAGAPSSSGKTMEEQILEAGLTAKKASSIKWKGFSKGQLKEHYEKHVVKQKEFGDISQIEYLNLAKDFAKENGKFNEANIRSFIIKHDPSTGRILVGHSKSREIRTFYVDDGRNDAFKSAIEFAKRL